MNMAKEQMDLKVDLSQRSLRVGKDDLQDSPGTPRAKQPLAYQRLCARIVATPTFENASLLIIIFNALWLGVDLDYKPIDDKKAAEEWIWEFGEHVFCIGFTVELLVRILADRHCLAGFLTTPHGVWKWHLFDTFLVVVMVLETWIMPYILQIEIGVDVSILRLLRLLRLSRILHMVPELGMMVTSLIAAVRSVSSTLVLEIGLMYVFAIIFTQWCKRGPCYDNRCVTTISDDVVCFKDYFGSIGDSFYTLTQIMVFDDAFMVIRACRQDTWYLGSLLILYIAIACFTLLNMLVGVICEIVSITVNTEREAILRGRVEEVFTAIDRDNSGTITRTEFDEEAFSKLVKLGIDQSLLTNAFDIIDSDGTGSLEMEEFVEMIFKLTHPPEAQDLLTLHQKVDALAAGLGVVISVCGGPGTTRRKSMLMRSASRFVDDSSAATRQMSPAEQGPPRGLEASLGPPKMSAAELSNQHSGVADTAHLWNSTFQDTYGPDSDVNGAVATRGHGLSSMAGRVHMQVQHTGTPPRPPPPVATGSPPSRGQYVGVAGHAAYGSPGGGIAPQGAVPEHGRANATDMGPSHPWDW